MYSHHPNDGRRQIDNLFRTADSGVIFASVMDTKKTEWFESWFDSPFYHILYKDRDDKEAKLFLDNLINHLHPGQGAKILDVACGKGRHSLYLNRKGFTVCGFDLSKESILHNKKNETKTLTFTAVSYTHLTLPTSDLV